MYINIYNQAGTSIVSTLSEHLPTRRWTPDVFEGLSFESCNPGGFTVAEFTLHRPVTQYYTDMVYKNRIQIGEAEARLWEGYISKVSRRIKPDTLDVQCIGWSGRLNELGATADITATPGTYMMSTFITGVLVADADCEIATGTVAVTDYAYPIGTRFEFNPYTSYFDALEQLNAGNLYDWGVWLDQKIDFTAKTPTVIDYLVWTGDCNDLSISPNPETYGNRLLTRYSQDGSHYQDIVSNNAAGQALYGIVVQTLDIPGKITTAGATQAATTRLAEIAALRVTAEFTCNRIFNAQGVEVPIAEARAGKNVRVVDWLPTEETLTGVNEIATFQIKSTSYGHDNGTLAITPSEPLSATDIKLARLEATGY